VTLKLFNFESVEEYYIKSSSKVDIEHLKIPSIFFNAENDLLSPIDTIDFSITFHKNPYVILLLTRYGGHVCWFKGIMPKRWFLKKTEKWIDGMDNLIENPGLLEITTRH
jgi:abhydrolase domain-containing protein 1/3